MTTNPSAQAEMKKLLEELETLTKSLRVPHHNRLADEFPKVLSYIRTLENDARFGNISYKEASALKKEHAMMKEASKRPSPKSPPNRYGNQKSHTAEYDPGGDAAINEGCTCPILDNGHGNEELSRHRGFWIDADCPLHAKT